MEKFLWSVNKCLLNYPYFKNYYKLIAIDLKKQEKLFVDTKATQQINFAGNTNRREGPTMFIIVEEAKETVLDYSNGTVEILWFYLVLTKH